MPQVLPVCLLEGTSKRPHSLANVIKKHFTEVALSTYLLYTRFQQMPSVSTNTSSAAFFWYVYRLPIDNILWLFPLSDAYATSFPLVQSFNSTQQRFSSSWKPEGATSLIFHVSLFCRTPSWTRTGKRLCKWCQKVQRCWASSVVQGTFCTSIHYRPFGGCVDAGNFPSGLCRSSGLLCNGHLRRELL